VSGALHKLVENMIEYVFRAEAKVEEKKLEANGEKEGEDFLKGA
jgi:hypothetical protein